MLEIFFRTIPKATNEIIFILGVLGLCLDCLLKKKNVYVHVVLFVVLGMLFWRCAYKINSSRYASALIYPFSFLAALFLSYLARAKWKVAKIICFLVGVGTLINAGYKNYNIKQINSNLKIIAELHNKFNSKEKEWTLITSSQDVGRIGRMDGENNPIEMYYSDKTTDDVCTYISNHRSINKNVLFNVTLKTKESDKINLDSPFSRYKHILSIYLQKNKKKRENVYAIESRGEIKTISVAKAIPPESGILKNGDLEQLDSPEESYRKFKNHIGHYSLYYDADESKRTAVNAYFYNTSNDTKYLPYYSCLNAEAISGKNSARIVSRNGYGYILFLQRFYSGTYHYSAILSGEKGTTVCILYDLYANKKWNVRSLANYTIPSIGVYKIKVSFSVPTLNPGEYFIVGAWVRGDAYLDNFCLNKIDE